MNDQNKRKAVFQPTGQSALVSRGTTLLEAARKAGVNLPTRCGGKAGCLMCKVTVSPEQAAGIRPPGDIERRKLGSAVEQGQRLACQAAVWDDVIVQVPEDPLKAAIRRKLEAARRGEDDMLW